MSIREFEHYMPVKLVFGRGRISEAGKIIAEYGSKAMIVTGQSSSKKSGLMDKVTAGLERERVASIMFDHVNENPLTTLAEEGAAEARKLGCDVIVGLGGGSVLDAAKVIAFLAVNEGNASDYIFGKQGTGALPVIAITTTAGTGSEGDSLAVLTNPVTRDKKSLKSVYIYPKVSIIDPELMMTLPPYLIASTGFDALCHCIEAYVSRRNNPVTDQFAINGIEMIAKNLPKVYCDPQDIGAWEDMALANTYGGMVIDSAGVALAHGLEHPVSGLLNIRHGEGLAAIFPTFMEYSCPSSPSRFKRIAEALGEDVAGMDLKEGALKSLDAVKKLMAEIGLNMSLGKLGVKPEHLEWLAQNSLRTMSYAIGNSPRIPDAAEIAELYRWCL